jgi:diguanylate cyclase (GGDEF)-like protein
VRALGGSEGNGENGRVVVAARDVTRRRESEARLRHEITHDRLTGLPNRARMMEAIGAALSEPGAPKQGISILAVDIDQFKTINDTLGLQVGDRLLVAFGQRLRAAVPSAALVARSGGDEFAVLPPPEMDAAALAAAICDTARVPFTLDDLEVFVSASVGVVTGESAGSADDVLRAADRVTTAREAELRFLLSAELLDLLAARGLTVTRLRDALLSRPSAG